MYLCSMYSKELLKGTLRTIILKLLAEQGQMYGYQITQEVKTRTKEAILLTEGALYPTLHKLEAEGLLTTEKVYVGKRVRKYYQLTETGNAAAVAKVQEFADFVRTMQGLLEFKLEGG